jgi:hypothetical protein
MEIQLKNTGFPRIKYPVSSTGQAKAGLVKPGMANKGKRFQPHYTGREKILTSCT